MQCEALVLLNQCIGMSSQLKERIGREKKIKWKSLHDRYNLSMILLMKKRWKREKNQRARIQKKKKNEKRKPNTVQRTITCARDQHFFLFCPVLFTTYFFVLVYFTQDFVTFLLFFFVFAPTIHMKHSAHDVCAVYSIALTTKCIIATLAGCSHKRCGKVKAMATQVAHSIDLK